MLMNFCDNDDDDDESVIGVVDGNNDGNCTSDGDN